MLNEPRVIVMRTSACVATYVDLQQDVDVVVVQTLKSRFYHIIRVSCVTKPALQIQMVIKIRHVLFFLISFWYDDVTSDVWTRHHPLVMAV